MSNRTFIPPAKAPVFVSRANPALIDAVRRERDRDPANVRVE